MRFAAPGAVPLNARSSPRPANDRPPLPVRSDASPRRGAPLRDPSVPRSGDRSREYVQSRWVERRVRRRGRPCRNDHTRYDRGAIARQSMLVYTRFAQAFSPTFWADRSTDLEFMYPIQDGLPAETAAYPLRRCTSAEHGGLLPPHRWMRPDRHVVRFVDGFRRRPGLQDQRLPEYGFRLPRPSRRPSSTWGPEVVTL
jgi:hypothetical protein